MTPFISSVPYRLPPEEYLILPISSRLCFGIIQTSANYIEGLLLMLALNDILLSAIKFVSAVAWLKVATAPIESGDIPQKISNVTSCLNNLYYWRVAAKYFFGFVVSSCL